MTRLTLLMLPLAALLAGCEIDNAAYSGSVSGTRAERSLFEVGVLS